MAAVRRDIDIELIVLQNNPDKQQLWVQANIKEEKYRIGVMYGYPILVNKGLTVKNLKIGFYRWRKST